MKHKPRALVIFTPAFPKDDEDTEWLPWLQLTVKAINRNFKDLKIIVFAFQYPHQKIYEWNGNKVMAFNGMQRTKVKRIWMRLDIMKKYRKVYTQYSITGIFSMWCGECTLIAKWCARLSRVPFYCWILGGDARSPNKFISRIKPKPSELIAMSDFLAEQFASNHGIRPLHMITNGIEPTLFNPMPLKRSIEITGAGGFSFLKRYDIFVEVVAALKNNIPAIRAVLCGSGSEMDISDLVKTAGLENNIELPGYTRHIDTIERMQHSKIFLHPSSYEGFSSVCLEALYAGAHVISFIKPMHSNIPNWHIVHTQEEMIAKALVLLQDTTLIHERVLIKTFDDISHDIMHLFNKHD